MKSIILLTSLFTTVSSFAAFSGAPIDLTKFEKGAKEVLRSRGLSDSGTIFFQDGVLPNEMTAEYEDLADLYFVSENALYNFRVTYVVHLSTGMAELQFLSLNNKQRVESSVGMIVEFDTNADTNSIKAKLEKKYPNIEIVKLGLALNIYIKDYTFFSEVQTALEDVRQNDNPQNTYFNEQFYMLSPPIFGGLQALQPVSLDLDKLRDVVPHYVHMGAQFQTTTTLIPDIFKP